MNLKFRIGNLELRSCDKHLISDSEHTTAEIVSWYNNNEKDYCCTIAYWTRDDEGFYLKFVGDRPFDDFEHWNDFGKLAKQGQEILNEYFYEGNII